MTDPILSAADIDALNAARAILERVQGVAQSEGWRPTTRTDDGTPVGGFDYGYVAHAAHAAENAVFQVLNCANAYLHLALTHEQLHRSGAAEAVSEL